MTIQERIDEYTKFVDDASRVNDNQVQGMALHMEPLAAQLTRLLALVKAAEAVRKSYRDAVSNPHNICDEQRWSDFVGTLAISEALAELRKHGDIPAETGT